MISCLMSAFTMVVVLKNPLETCLVLIGSMMQGDLPQGCHRCLRSVFPQALKVEKPLQISAKKSSVELLEN